jgi:hypothetical protein
MTLKIKSGAAAMNKQDLLHAPVDAQKVEDQAARDEIERNTQAFLKSGGKITVLKTGISSDFEDMTAKQMSEHRYNTKVTKGMRAKKNEHS